MNCWPGRGRSPGGWRVRPPLFRHYPSIPGSGLCPAGPRQGKLCPGIGRYPTVTGNRVTRRKYDGFGLGEISRNSYCFSCGKGLLQLRVRVSDTGSGPFARVHDRRLEAYRPTRSGPTGPPDTAARTEHSPKGAASTRPLPSEPTRPVPSFPRGYSGLYPDVWDRHEWRGWVTIWRAQ